MPSTPEDPTTASAPDRSFGSRLRYVLGDVAALVYLAFIAALVIWVYVDSAGEHEDASFAGVIPLLATAPASVLVLLPPEFPGMFVVAVTVGALVNAVVIGWCSRRLRRGGRAAR